MGFSHSSEAVSVRARGGEGGGAALDQVIGMSAVAVVVTLGLLWIGYLHRQRRITWLNNLAEWAARKFKRPPWVALPMALFITTLICALFGFIWDVSLHIGKGRDPGPLANPAHYFILFGLFLLFIAGCLACVLPYDKPGPSAVRITRNWYAPVGGILMAGCGLYALTGFPLDDIWHRIFGRSAAKRAAGSSSFRLVTAQIAQLHAATPAKSSLFNAAAVSGNLETLFEQMYRRYRSSLPPDHLMMEHRAPVPHAASSAELCS